MAKLCDFRTFLNIIRTCKDIHNRLRNILIDCHMLYCSTYIDKKVFLLIGNYNVPREYTAHRLRNTFRHIRLLPHQIVEIYRENPEYPILYAGTNYRYVDMGADFYLRKRQLLSNDNYQYLRVIVELTGSLLFWSTDGYYDIKVVSRSSDNYIEGKVYVCIQCKAQCPELFRLFTSQTYLCCSKCALYLEY